MKVSILLCLIFCFANLDGDCFLQRFLPSHLRNHAGLVWRPDWLQIVGSSLAITERIKAVASVLDLSAGAGGISTPNQENSSSSVNMTDFLDAKNFAAPSPQLRIYQLSTKVLKRLPDPVLLGLLVVISSELLQREVQLRSPLLPPLLQEIANTTTENLDMKLQKLSSLEWEYDKFVQDELLDLQLQPLEVIDKYIVKELLPRVDKDLSPLLSKLLADPTKVTQITQNIKDLIQLAALVLIKFDPKVNKPLEKTTVRQLIQQVDLVGAGVEDVLREWNKIVADLGNLIKAESVIALIPESMLPTGLSKSALTKFTSAVASWQYLNSTSTTWKETTNLSGLSARRYNILGYRSELNFTSGGSELGSHGAKDAAFVGRKRSYGLLTGSTWNLAKAAADESTTATFNSSTSSSLKGNSSERDWWHELTKGFFVPASQAAAYSLEPEPAPLSTFPWLRRSASGVGWAGSRNNSSTTSAPTTKSTKKPEQKKSGE